MQFGSGENEWGSNTGERVSSELNKREFVVSPSGSCARCPRALEPIQIGSVDSYRDRQLLGFEVEQNQAVQDQDYELPRVMVQYCAASSCLRSPTHTSKQANKQAERLSAARGHFSSSVSHE